jgi:hypothetical protein
MGAQGGSEKRRVDPEMPDSPLADASRSRMRQTGGWIGETRARQRSKIPGWYRTRGQGGFEETRNRNRLTVPVWRC